MKRNSKRKKKAKMTKIIVISIAVVILLPILTVVIGKMINAQRYKIRSASGIQESAYVTLGGIEQYIQIRGQDISNPVLIVLHGGPGSNMAYYSYGWQQELEANYTIVNWDQRGCGNTYYKNPDAPKPTLDLLVSDLDELVDYVSTKFNQEKVIIMGHSWGTFLGTVYTGRYPEKVTAYVGVGQMIDLKESEKASTAEAVLLATERGKIADSDKMKTSLATILNYDGLNQDEAMELYKFRSLKEKYLPQQYGNRYNVYQLFSPYMTWNDLKWMANFKGLVNTNSEIYSLLYTDKSSSLYDYPLDFDVPMIIISGSNDWTTPVSITKDYYEAIEAPRKEFILIDDTGHIPFCDKPEEFAKVFMENM